MSRARHTEAEIITVLKQVEAGRKAEDVATRGARNELAFHSPRSTASRRLRFWKWVPHPSVSRVRVFSHGRVAHGTNLRFIRRGV